MLLLEGSHRTVVDNLMEMLTRKKELKLLRFSDFHGSQWELYHDGESKVYIMLMVNISKSRLVKWGMKEHLKEVYGKALVTGELPEEVAEIVSNKEPDACLCVEDKDQWRDLTPLSKADKENLEEECVRYGALYKNCMTAAFEYHFSRANDDELFDPVRLAYRDNESMYIGASKDNCAVYYCMWFETEDDILYGRLFLQEFADAKKHNRNIAGAPSCSFSKERPKELAGVKNAEPEDPHRLWITLSLFRKHTDTSPAVLDKTVDMLLQFRNYVKYHISCAHAYIHSRMRSRHATLLQILNRAKTHQTDHVATRIQ